MITIKERIDAAYRSFLEVHGEPQKSGLGDGSSLTILGVNND